MKINNLVIRVVQVICILAVFVGFQYGLNRFFYAVLPVILMVVFTVILFSKNPNLPKNYKKNLSGAFISLCLVGTCMMGIGFEASHGFAYWLAVGLVSVCDLLTNLRFGMSHS